MLQVRVLLGAPVFNAAVAPPVQEAAMAETKNQTLKGIIRLDGNTFRDCEFVDARLIFEGGAPPNFINCRFTNSNFTFRKRPGTPSTSCAPWRRARRTCVRSCSA
jgi:hypothetical protein